MFPSELNDDNRLKVLKKVTKDCEDGYVQVGLQLSSFEKYFPSVVDNDEVFEMKNKHIIIHAKQFFIGKDFSEYENILKEWKNNIKLSPNEKKKNKEISKIESNEKQILSVDSLIIVNNFINKRNIYYKIMIFLKRTNN